MDLKALIPRGLFARSLLIIVLPVAIMQMVVTYLFFDLHWEQVSRRLSEGAAGDVALVTQLYADNPTPENLASITNYARADLRLSVALQKQAKLPERERLAAIPAFDRTLRRALSGSLRQKFWFDTTRYPDYVDIRVEVPGGVLRFLAYRDRVFASTGGIFILWLAGATILLATVSVLFIRNQVRPMERLADAAERFGRGENVSLKPAGSAEVRRATLAFLQMRGRIQRHIEQRTNLLAGVSHDLRTPLTRLKLQLAMMPPSSDIDEARKDIVEMEGMLEEYLAFAQGQWSEEREVLDLAEIARAVIQDAARAGRDIDGSGLADSLPTSGRPIALKRCLSNLVENALSFGQTVALSSSQSEDAIYIYVDDDGPGIAPESYEEALKPFSRLDPARNQNRKGVGLGLALAYDAARSHGGNLVLSRSTLGGLRVSVRLPL
ncbi:MAG: ATP-binding protein [Aquidulcibacter sp.]|jgi:two-component system osmolarity sensor histidine kinase EnvZ|uniref:ATP-binding protein n=1 Tax=Aquidulcibacter sp. TaxID=2052990 RepID=UPI0022BB4942|nr:ATP-binding protein [Aquidulcibacter sp.]MCE2891374.1 ATP-binding protein [Hyphomonadaceae bacterium]MCZ8208586.1 ATP-binding protein [Aquidulcibacter sp.]